MPRRLTLMSCPAAAADIRAVATSTIPVTLPRMLEAIGPSCPEFLDRAAHASCNLPYLPGLVLLDGQTPGRVVLAEADAPVEGAGVELVAVEGG